MSFTKRMVRMRQEAGIIEAPHSKSPTDSSALAAEHIQLKLEVEEKDISWPRASSLYKCCIRQHVIGDILGKKVKDFLYIKDKLTYGIGNAVHYWLQNTPDILGDKRRGWWKCLACRKVLYFGGPPTRKCPNCGAYPEAISYKEHYIRGVGQDDDGDPRYFQTGHPDMFLEKKNSSLLRVAEFKTIGSEDFDKFKAPLIEHEWQLQDYMWACSLDERLPVKIDPNVGYILYICKRHRVKDLPFKMFKVRRNEEMLNRIKEKLDLFRTGRINFPNQLPAPDPRCLRGGMDSYMTKSCVVREDCLKYYGEE
jgi:hypothetical protein